MVLLLGTFGEVGKSSGWWWWDEQVLELLVFMTEEVFSLICGNPLVGWNSVTLFL
jgi:hypothetical protein